MLQKNNKRFYQSTLLASTQIIHGYSFREWGDMRMEANRYNFIKILGLDDYSLVMPQQVHGREVAILNKTSENKISSVDGLVYRQPGHKKIALGVITADCIPIMAVDRVARVIGIAHAGWKGTLNGISKNLIKNMENLGTNKTNILVAMGPHIGACCYSVTSKCAEKFINLLGQNEKAISFWDKAWHLDLGYINFLQLIKSGIVSDHIDTSLACTSCQWDKWFSYRKDTKESFGEMLSIIAL